MINFESINLKFNRDDFKDIYFKDNRGNLFFGQTVKGHFIALLVFATALVLAIIFSELTDQLWGASIVLFFIFFIALFDYLWRMSSILKWKRQVNAYLERLSKYKLHKIYLTFDSISLIQDDEETIIKWSAFTKATMSDEFISLISTDVFLFPKKSMADEEYQYLRHFISDKFKNETGKIVT
jgi:c-di-AMP phosphodiesterase-like protein